MKEFNFLGNFATIDWNSPWVVGVGTTIFGVGLGFLVNLLAKRFLPKKDSKQYLQDVKSANQEIIATLRTSVSESSLPSRQIVESLLRATARNYGIKLESLMSIIELSDYLIKDIMDSNFIPYHQKLKYCQEIEVSFGKKPIRSSAAVETRVRENIVYINRYEKQLRDNSINFISLVVATIVVVSGISSTFLNRNDTYSSTFGQLDNFLIPYISVITGLVVTALVFVLYRNKIVRIKSKKEEVKENINKEYDTKAK